MTCYVCEKPAVHDCFVGRFCDACLTGLNKAVAAMNALPEHAACGNCAHFEAFRCNLLEISVSIEGRCQHWIRSSAPTSEGGPAPSDPPTDGQP